MGRPGLEGDCENLFNQILKHQKLLNDFGLTLYLLKMLA